MPNTFYDKMTGLYSISKTLRFELIPSKHTKNSLNFEKDKKLKEYYPIVKEKLDEFHVMFIKRALENHQCELIGFLDKYKEFLKLKKNKSIKLKEFKDGLKIFNHELEKFRKDLGITFDNYAQVLNDSLTKESNFETDENQNENESSSNNLKSSNLKKYILSGKVLKIVKQYEINNWNPNTIDAFEAFDKFSSYFTGFHRTRENIYSIKEEKTSINYRIINENLLRFCDNIIENDIYKDLNEFVEFQYLFDLNYFNKSITQSGIDEYNKNIADYKSKLNLYLQATKHESKKSRFKILYKLMLTKRPNLFEIYDNNKIQILIEKLYADVKMSQTSNNKILEILSDSNNLDNIYFNSKLVSSLSSECFGGPNFGVIENILVQEKLATKKVGKTTINQFIELNQFISVLNKLKIEYIKPSKLFKTDYFESKIIDDDDEFGKCFLNILINKFNTLIIDFKKTESTLESHIIGKQEYNKDDEIILNEEKIKLNKILKEYADSCLKIDQFYKTFALFHDKKDYSNELTTNEEFYNETKKFLDIGVYSYYDIFRNYSSKKPFSQDKIKVNFDNATLLDGWSKSKEKDNFGTIINNNGTIELVILKPNFKNIFDDTSEVFNNPTDNFTKMEYLLLGGAVKQIPKGIFTASNENLFTEILNDRLLKIRKDESFKVGDKFIKDDLTYWIDAIKKAVKISPSWKKFNFTFKKESKDYYDISGFYKELDEQGYNIKFTPLNQDKIEQFDKENKIYRFIIKNKDSNPKSNIKKSDKKNLYSIYWENLFTNNNLDNVILKLNGEAEIFRREASLPKEIDIDRKTNHPITISKRYTEDKLFFHVPITFNHINKKILKFNEFLTANTDKSNLKYLGVDRGENNLVYITLIDNLGNILMQEDLNTFNKIDYAEKINTKVKNRDQSKLMWEEIGNIKELKSGYLSYVVNKIVNIAIEEGALIVLENLNYGFKKSRTIKFEKAVYQKFEVALATKLQYVVQKDKKDLESGGALKGYQLAPKLDKVSDLDKANNWGIIKYVPAAYTSKIDPITEWRQHHYLPSNTKDIKEIFNPKNKEYIKVLWSITHNCYGFEYTNNNIKYQLFAHSEIERFREEKNKAGAREPKIYNSEKINSIFKEILLPHKTDKDIELNLEIIKNQDFKWKQLSFLYQLVSQIRNKIKDQDVIQSPIFSEKIKGFFDSRKYEEYKSKYNLVLPKDGDANGSYHIAKKALFDNLPKN
jgi:RuvC nuclease domain/Alpha helical recognition lobe domain